VYTAFEKRSAQRMKSAARAVSLLRFFRAEVFDKFGVSFLRHLRKSPHFYKNLNDRSDHRGEASASTLRLFLGQLLSSRAALRFTGCPILSVLFLTVNFSFHFLG
jgi:hypothetical protein